MAVRLLRAALGLPLAAAKPERNKLPIWHAGWQRHHPCPRRLPAGLDKDIELASYSTKTTTLRRRRQRSTKLTTLGDEETTSLHPPTTGNPLQSRTRGPESPQPSPEFRSSPIRRRPASPAPSEHSLASSSESWSDSDSPTATALGPFRRRSAHPTAETARPSEREADALWRRHWD
jgi:hypothetical protein